MKIGVFVGSFNPVHKGHENIINYLINEKIVDKVIVIATGNYWDKQNLLDLNLRIKMLELIKKDNIIIDKEHNKMEYTYEILDSLKEKNPNDEFYLVIGSDNANTLYKWKCYERLLKHGIIVINRNDIKITLNIEKLLIINKKFGYMSSSIIRNDLDKNKRYLNKKVYDFIKENNLYERM